MYTSSCVACQVRWQPVSFSLNKLKPLTCHVPHREVQPSGNRQSYSVDTQLLTNNIWVISGFPGQPRMELHFLSKGEMIRKALHSKTEMNESGDSFGPRRRAGDLPNRNSKLQSGRRCHSHLSSKGKKKIKCPL